MTNEQLTAYLQDESYLYSVGYEELKTLVMQYPYSANLRILLLKKSYLDKHKDYDRNLQMSATYTTNRKHLYKTIKRLKSFKLVPQNVILGEEYLELTELSNIERLLAERQVSQAVQTATKLDSLAPDWKLEIDDIAFNGDTEKGQFDLSNLSQNKEKKSKKTRTDEEEIDSLINSLVTEFNEPALDKETIENDGNETLLVENTTSISETKDVNFEEFVDETKEAVHTSPVSEIKNIDFEEFVDETIEAINTTPVSESQNTDFEEFVDAEITASAPLDLSELSPSVSDDVLFDFMTENTENIETKELIHDEEIKNEDKTINESLLKRENIEPQLDLEKALPTYETALTTIKKESVEDVKETDIQLEIVNPTKASIVERKGSDPVYDKRPSFTEWLGQFRMTSPKSSPITSKTVETAIEIFDNQIVTPSEATESIRRISRQNMVEIFETKSEVPDNLFGPSDEETSVHFEEDDDDDDDDVFSDYESNPNKKKKSRPMHQLAIKSLVQDDELVSETLADLLAWQGNKTRATEMYRKLILQFPEKSSYFATKIEKISI
jgi:hypothetical protein